MTGVGCGARLGDTGGVDDGEVRELAFGTWLSAAAGVETVLGVGAVIAAPRPLTERAYDACAG